MRGRTRTEACGPVSSCNERFCGLFCAYGRLALSGWRFVLLCKVPSALRPIEILPMPAFLDLWVPRSHLVRLKQKRKGRFGLLLAKHFGLLILDLLQLMESGYILFTLVGVPHYIRRVLAWRAYSVSVTAQTFRPNKHIFSALDGAAHPLSVKSLMHVLPHHPLLFPYLDPKSLCACREVSSEWAIADEDRYWMRLFLSWWPQSMVAMEVVTNFKAFYKDRHIAELQSHATPQHELDYKLGHRYLLHMEFLHSLTLIRHFFLIRFKLVGVLFGVPVFLLSYVRYMLLLNRLPRLLQSPFSNDQANLFWSEFKRCSTFWNCHLLFGMGAFHLAILNVNELAVLLTSLNLAVLYVSTLGVPLLLKLSPDNPVLNGLMNSLLALSLPVFLFLNAYLLFLPNLVWWTTWGSWTLMSLASSMQTIVSFFLSIMCSPLRLVGLNASTIASTFVVAGGSPASFDAAALFKESINVLASAVSSCVEASLVCTNFLLFLIGFDDAIDYSWSVLVGQIMRKAGVWMIFRFQIHHFFTAAVKTFAFVLQNFMHVWQGAWKFADLQLITRADSASLAHLFLGSF